MAYPSRGRDPLFDDATQAILERRGRELIGLVLLFIGGFLSLMLATYSADDAGWLIAGGAVSNWTGRFGATLADPMLKFLGFGTWAVAITFVIWGVRFVLHAGSDRFMTRGIYAPIFWLFSAIFAATFSPDANWVHQFSLGGDFGDTLLTMILGPFVGGTAFPIQVVVFVIWLFMVMSGAYMSGLVYSELQWAKYHTSLLLSRLLVWVLTLSGSGPVGVGRRAAAAPQDPAEFGHDAMFERAPTAGAPTAEAQRVVSIIRANPVMPTYDAPDDTVVEFDDAAPETQSLFARMPSLLRRAQPTPEPHVGWGDEPPLTDPMMDDAGVDPRMRSKIQDVIRARSRPPSVIAGASQMAEPVVPSHPGVSQKVAEAVQSRLIGGAVPQPVQGAEGGNIFADDDDDDLFPPAQQHIQPQMSRAAQVAADPYGAVMIPPQTPPQAPTAQAPVVERRAKRAIQPSKKAQAEAQPRLQFTAPEPKRYEEPPLALLMDPAGVERHVLSDDALEENARMLENVLDDYGVKGEIVSVRPGPVVTMYELEPAPGLKASRVIGLSDDIARSMSALSARVSTVPGRSVIGIELPNEKREICVLREVLASRDFGDANMRLPLALGKDIGGEPIVANLAKMPHLLIAGTTGSGKSVAINTMILSLLYSLSPDDCRMIMIDPKMLELSVYDGIPHLLSPVVTDPKKAVVALKWVVGEMEDRYRKMSKMGVRNIEGYNSRVNDALSKNEMFSRTVQTGFDDETGEPVFETEEFAPEKLPYIVVVVDEMADLMMVAGKEIEACIQRLAQMARASGIHLIMATQRPSVDVITGTIKANFPTRISFQVTSKVDSRTILGEMGAEQLLGMGDMLYMEGGGKITRVHGPFCSDEEVEDVVSHLKRFGPPDYVSGVVDGPSDESSSNIDEVLGLGGNTDGEDALYDTAVQVVIKDRKCSTSYIQRKLAIGYNKAARLVEQMEDNGLVSPANHVGKREILVPEQG